MITKRKALEYELRLAETYARDAGMDFPVAWALLWLYDNHKILDARLYEPSDYADLRKELAGIVDWIESGDPELRRREDN